MTSALQPLARASRVWLLWLGLVLLAANSLAVLHPYSHSIVEAAGQSDQKYQIDLADCGLCLAGVANLGSAPPMVSSPLPPPLGVQAPLPTRLAAVPLALARQTYAIRAPPVIAG